MAHRWRSKNQVERLERCALCELCVALVSVCVCCEWVGGGALTASAELWIATLHQKSIDIIIKESAS